MKILSISNCPLIDSQGSGYVIVNFCQRLREQGHEIDLFGPESYEPCRFLQGKGKNYRQAVGMLIISLRQIRKKQYDVVEFYGGQSWLAAIFLSKRRKRKYILVSHSNGLETHYAEVAAAHWGADTAEGEKRKWYQMNQTALFERAFTCVDGIVTVSQIDAMYALQHKYQDDVHTVFIDNSLPESFLGLEVSFERPCTIGYCGSWIERKGIHTIKSDMTEVLRKHQQWSFKLIGVGKNFKKEDHFPEDVQKQIMVVPFVTDKNDLLEIYKSLSILVMPSVYESFGLVAAEAMACGCALVATKVGFPAALEHKKEAWIMESSTSPLLFEGVNELIQSDDLRLEIARNGYKRVQNLCWERATDTIENTYRTWLEEKQLEDCTQLDC